MDQLIQYCTASDGVRLAYSTIGKGTPIVRASHWMTHLEHELMSPVRRSFILGLAHRHSLVRYDARGNGLSQRDVTEISFERWVGDLERIVDSASLDRFALLGMSQGASISIQYAVRHPERVSHLIIYGGFARGSLHSEDLDKQKHRLELARTLVREGWGSDHEEYRQWFTSQFIPGGTAEQFHLFNDLQRVSATPEMAERYLVEVAKINVAALLPNVKTPTLVLHSKGDVRVPFALGQEIAAGIPGAKFIPLNSRNHILLADEPAFRGFFDAVATFLGDPPIKGPLPGMSKAGHRLDSAVKNIEQNWLIKVIVMLAAITGVVIFFMEMWRILRH
jgi:pimeloyl-ACP methyl ester carboxylesterase